jgi:osmotically-inducible protein OsmY
MMRSVLVVCALMSVLQACAPLVVAGVAGGVLVADDRRKTGVVVDDQSIELTARRRFSEELGQKAHINITSYNWQVLLTGEAPSAEISARAEEIVKGVEKVKRVVNELRIAAPSGLGARSADSVTTTKVKTRFVSENRFRSNHVKVVTEAGVVYLMGIVSKQEADDAADIASTTGGVQKVVKLFEYRG